MMNDTDTVLNPTASRRGFRMGVMLLLLGLASVALTGCAGSYAIEGKVIQGPSAQVLVVSSSDARLKESDLSGAGATVEGIFEPNNRIDRRPLNRVRADGEGYFSLPVNETGAGFLEYEATIIARKDGYTGVMQTIALPSRRQRLLIVMPRGRENLRVPEDFLDEALREAKPYLEE